MGEEYPVKAGMPIVDLPGLVTPRAFGKGVADILDSLPEECACGVSNWIANDGTRIVCASRGKAAEFKSGDELTAEWLKDVNDKENIF